MKRISRITLVVILIGGFLFASCTKEEVIPTKDNKENGDQSTGQNSQGSGG